MEIFTIKELSFTYPNEKEPAIQAINLSIRTGTIHVIFGESGSGKSTLLKLLKPELSPIGKKVGNIYYDGQLLENIHERVSAAEIGFVMQNLQTQIVTDTVWHELAFGLENLGIAPYLIRQRVAEIANFLGIQAWYHQKTTELSGGQKQILNLASVLAMQPKVLIFDEPTAQLDPIAATKFIQMLQQINQELGITIILVEHRLEEVLAIADQVSLLERGRLLVKDMPENIGNYLFHQQEEHRLFLALPTPTQVFLRLNHQGKNPLTIREGREFLNSYVGKVENSETIINSTNNEEKSEEIVIHMKNIWFRYVRDARDIVTGVNFQMQKGEIISLLGGNGSGKTTLLRIMSGQLQPQRGSIRLNGKKLKNYKKGELYHQQVAVLPQDPLTMFIGQTIRQDYAEISPVMGYSDVQFDKLLSEIVTELNIGKLLERHPYDLSGGELQKVALGKLLLLQPKILLLDEPTKGMDARSKADFIDLLKRLQQSDISIMIVTHDIEFSAQVSNRCGLFFDGKIVSLTTPEQFFSQNTYYTTAASRMSRHIFKQTITTQALVEECLKMKEKRYEE